MDSVLRAALIYVFVLLMFRICGKRSLSEITTFDFVLLLIISEATQQALLGDDFSLINALVVIATLIVLDLTLSKIELVWPAFGRAMGSLPVILVEDGKLLEARAKKEGVTREEILEAGREKHGLERFEQVKYAILERHGGISVVPQEKP